MIKNVTIVLIAVVLSGCVSTKTVKFDQELTTGIQGKSMAVATSDKPSFAAMTAGKAMFAAIGAVAMINAGNKIIQENGVEDPAEYIAQALADEMSRSWQVNVVQPTIPSEESEISYLIDAHSDSDYIFDVRTINWSFGYFPTDWSHYRVIYSAKSRLINVKEKQVVAEAFCSRVPEKADDSPTHDELLSNNAARLKEELKIAAEHCVNELRGKLF